MCRMYTYTYVYWMQQHMCIHISPRVQNRIPTQHLSIIGKPAKSSELQENVERQQNYCGSNAFPVFTPFSKICDFMPTFLSCSYTHRLEDSFCVWEWSNIVIYIILFRHHLSSVHCGTDAWNNRDEISTLDGKCHKRTLVEKDGLILVPSEYTSTPVSNKPCSEVPMNDNLCIMFVKVPMYCTLMDDVWRM